MWLAIVPHARLISVIPASTGWSLARLVNHEDEVNKTQAWRGGNKSYFFITVSMTGPQFPTELP
jgi:hypothetical protein